VTAYETFTMEGGPLDGRRIELAHDVFHPDTRSITMSDGAYERAGWNAQQQRVMRWTEKRTTPPSVAVRASDEQAS
jgi:hypothetical protein